MQIEIINGTLHQWDTGRQVQVTLDEGTTLREVRFSHHRSPSPVRVAPEAGNVADIPDELLRHSGMLWVTAIVVDAYGKPQTHSRCVCTECAVRPDDYNAGGGSGDGSAGGGSGSHKFIIRIMSVGSSGEIPVVPFKYQDIMDAFQEEHDKLFAVDIGDEGALLEYGRNAVKPMDFQLITTLGGDPSYGPNNGKSPVGDCSYETAIAVRYHSGGDADRGIYGSHFSIFFLMAGEIVITASDEIKIFEGGFM